MRVRLRSHCPAGRSISLAGAALLAVALTALMGGALASDVHAQAAPSVVSTSQRVDLQGGSVEFEALLDGGDQVESAILFYRVLPEGAITRLQAEVAGGDVVRLAASVPVNRGQTWIPAGSDLEWSWQLTTVDGDVIETAEQIWRYEDPRFDWIEISDDHLKLWYYGDNEGVAQRLHREGSEAIAEISDLLNVTLDFPARVYMWANPVDAGVIERRESETFEEQVLTGGTRVLADLVHIYNPTVWVVRHELTHILTKVAGEGGIGNLPAWLDEGTATFAEEDWRARRGAALNFAIDTDQLFTVRTMTSLTQSPGRIDIFYGQAGDIVTFLVNTFGAEKLAELFAVFKAGSTVDNALEAVYGLDRDGLTDAYRESLGLPPIGELEDRSTVIEDEPAEIEQAGGQAAEEPAVEDGAVADDGAAEASEGEAEEQSVEASSGAPRSEEAIDARREEIARRLATRRPAPVFGTGGDFPWEGVATGVGAGTLVVSVVLLWMLLSTGRATATAGPAPSFRRPQGPGSSEPSDRSSQPPITPASPPVPRAPRPPGEVAQWSGWRQRDDD